MLRGSLFPSDRRRKPKGVDSVRIIVVGCGKIGTALIDSLASEEHDIVVIDTNRRVLEEINNI